MDDQNKNMLLAILLSFAVVFVWSVFFTPPPPDPQTPAEIAEEGGSLVPTVDSNGQPAPESAEAPAAEAAARVPIETGRVTGSVNLRGGRIDDLKLADYTETIDPDSPIVTLLKPTGEPHAYFTWHGWWSRTGTPPEAMPNVNTVWTLESGDSLAVGTPVTLVWDNGQGQVFRKEIAIDENYLFTIRQSVSNAGSEAVSMYPYGIIERRSEPDDLKKFFVLHEGAIGAFDGELQEIKYKDLRDYEFDREEGANVARRDVTENGWIGFTDHYWMSTLIARPGQELTALDKYYEATDVYQTELRYPVVEIAPGETYEMETYLFSGAKEYYTIRGYQDTLGINQFVDSIDWGWFAFFTKPIFQALHFLKGFLGNMGLAIIGLTFVIKLILFPLAYKSYVSMSKMKLLQPEMEKIKENAGDDRMKLQQEMMALYKKEKVNPASGCLPILVQIPIFFSLYKVIFVTIDLRHAPFVGWIRDLSIPDPSSLLNLFGLLPWDAPGPGSFLAIFSIGVWPIAMGVTMWMQQKLNPAPTDKTQAMIFAWMPWVFMFMLGRFASGLVIYWTANNIITFVQQYTIMRTQGVKPDVFGNITRSFRRKKPEE